MIKGIALKKVEVTEEEYSYYKQLVKQYTNEKNKGEGYFENLFETDKEGKITLIKPTKSIPWEIMFFVQNLMINQWLRSYDSRISKLEKGIKNGK
jgi:hypothetical protein